MKLASFVFIGMVFITLNSACVTTRAELNQEKENANDQETQGSKEAEAASSSSGDYSSEELKAKVAELTGRLEEIEHQAKLKNDAQEENLKKLQAQVEMLQTQSKAQEKALEKAKEEAQEEAKKEAEKEAEKKAATETEAEIFSRAETNFKAKEYRKAILDYSKIGEKFATSSRHPQSLLKIAEAFSALGLKEDALAFYSELIEKFPRSAEAKLAKKRLKKK